MTVPLWILAFLTVFSGAINLPYVNTLQAVDGACGRPSW